MDDILVTGNGEEKTRQFKKFMMKMFEMTGLGLFEMFNG